MKIEMAKNDENYKRGQTSINDKKTELISVNNDIAELETLLTENV